VFVACGLTNAFCFRQINAFRREPVCIVGLAVGVQKNSSMCNRFLRAHVALVAAALSTATAQAETRVFILTNDPDGYGVDRCLATGASCGALAAASYCKAQQFSEARSFRRVVREDANGIVHGISVCHGQCDEFVAIECIR
jgi:hypothetical protein